MFLIGLSNFIIFLYLYLNWVHMFIALVKEEMEFAVHFFFYPNIWDSITISPLKLSFEESSVNIILIPL